MDDDVLRNRVRRIHDQRGWVKLHCLNCGKEESFHMNDPSMGRWILIEGRVGKMSGLMEVCSQACLRHFVMSETQEVE